MPSIKDTVKNLPNSPGVYQYYDSEDTLIYVGKAKNLKKRVSSYFNKKQENRKTKRLVEQIARIEYTVVPTERDALFLENSLIKQNQPRYNILLKDDKTYPYLCLLNERFPRLILTRTVDKRKGTFYGPYSNTYLLRSLLRFIQKEFKLRTCSLALSEENVSSGKYDVCLEYHIKNCLGPCENLQSEEDYNSNIKHVRNILKGNYNSIKAELKEQMDVASTSLNFEEAHKIKERIDGIELFRNKSLVANPKLGNLFVLTSKTIKKTVYSNYLVVRDGIITESKNNTSITSQDESTEAHIEQLIADTISHDEIESFDFISEEEIKTEFIDVHIPVIGDKKKLVLLSKKNLNKYISSKEQTPKQSANEIGLKELQQHFKLKELPKHIECFDNSNIQGTNPVSAMVCFINGKPAKKEYRHFKIKGVVGPNDFDSMTEVVSRRYSRLKNEGKQMPQLIVIDGGKGQLSAAKKALDKLELYIPVIGIAKRLEEIYFPEDNEPIILSKKSEGLKIVLNLRNEAHRFGITFHRNLRSKNSINSKLDTIEGLGPKTIHKLLSEYKSLNSIKKQKKEKIIDLIGRHKAAILFEQIKKGNL